MFYALLSFLRLGDPAARSILWHRNSITFPDSQDRPFKIEYYNNPTSEYSFLQVFPAPGRGCNNEPSLWLPPPHYHILQDEYFKVTSGAAVWYLYNRDPIRVNKGEEIVIKARQWHWFEPVSDVNEPLEVLYRYDKAYSDMEQNFFRNQFAYLDDCRKCGVNPSVFQAAVFSMHNWMALALPESKIVPEWVNLMLSLGFTWSMGTIGQFLLGYRPSYEEYYDKKAKRV